MDKNTCTQTKAYEVSIIFAGNQSMSEVWDAVSPLHAAFLMGGSFIDEIRQEADSLYALTGDMSYIETAVHNLGEHTTIVVRELTVEEPPMTPEEEEEAAALSPYAEDYDTYVEESEDDEVVTCAYGVEGCDCAC